MRERGTNAEDCFCDDGTIDAANVRVIEQCDAVKQITDDICPFATKPVGKVAERNVETEDNDGEKRLRDGDLCMSHTDGDKEKFHDRHRHISRGQAGLKNGQAEASASTLLARCKVVIAHINTSFLHAR